MLAETSAVSTLNQVENPLQESNSRSIYRARTFHYANDRSVQLTRSTPVENNWNEIHRVFFRFCYYDRCCCCCCCCCFVSSYYRFFSVLVLSEAIWISHSLFFFLLFDSPTSTHFTRWIRRHVINSIHRVETTSFVSSPTEWLTEIQSRIPLSPVAGCVVFPFVFSFFLFLFLQRFVRWW